MNIPWAVWVLQFKMVVRLQPCPLSRGPGKANALSAGRSIQCWMQDAAQVQSGGTTEEACAMVMGIEVPVRVRCAVAGCEGEGGRKCANGETGDEAGDRWQRQSGGRLRLVPKTPLSLSL